ncbi:type II toxin-antitoxin system HicB family antitoxin [Priestia megaterium]|uniref:type II toxin-antitoxin system HicB family antitoxin n=1 Tax=Priestia megaterium TaxID=1404 RepID=UPI00234F429D|nr:type II toxin-antitoxin system HicB family antitoxin [Priestia megaterium]MDC7781846.1 type II toxin-antitoxin system HicB family antitoxin [Priestia megaterium]
MAMYKFYSIIKWESEDSVFSVEFPDVPNCFTDGKILKEAIENAEDALGLLLSVLEDDGKDIPAPSPAKDIQVPEGANLILIDVETDNFKEAV